MDIERVRDVVSQMELADKVELTGGSAVRGVARLNVPSADFGTAFDTFSFEKESDEPTALALGCTFSEELCAAVAGERANRAIDKNYACYGSVACGLIADGLKPDAVRFFSDDPYLTKKMLYAYASANKLGCVFTDALGQGGGERTIDSRTLHETHLRPLSFAGMLATGLLLDDGRLNGAEVGRERAVCNEYSKLIGRECALFTRSHGADVLSGCGAFCIDSAESGKKKGIFGKKDKNEKTHENAQAEIVRRIENGTLSETKLNFAIERIIAFAANAHEFYKNPQKSEIQISACPSDMFFASAVLLENEILPTDKTPVIFGDKSAFADGKSYKPHTIAELNKRCGELNLVFITVEPTEAERRAIESAAGQSDLILVICGIPRQIDCSARAVLFCPYCPNISDVLEVIKGKEVKGRLPFAWRGEKVYPFGHGLTFTEFDISGAKASKADGKIRLSAKVRNTDRRAGSTVVQVYASFACADCEVKNRLIAYKRVELDAGDEKQVTFDVDGAELDAYDAENGRFVAAKGKCTFGIGLSANDIRCECKTKIT